MKHQNTNKIITTSEFAVLIMGLMMVSFYFLNSNNDTIDYLQKTESTYMLINTKNEPQRQIASLNTDSTNQTLQDLDIQKKIEENYNSYSSTVSKIKYQEAQIDIRTNRFLETSINPYESGQNNEELVRDYEIIEKHNELVKQLKEEESTEELEWDVAASSLEEEIN